MFDFKRPPLCELAAPNRLDAVRSDLEAGLLLEATDDFGND
jgi:hypothetical protein